MAFVSLMGVLVGISTVLSILSVAWHLRNEWADRRPRLAVTAAVMRVIGGGAAWMEAMGADPTLMFHIQVANLGKLPVTISSWGFDLPDGRVWAACVFGQTDRPLPAKLEQGEVLVGTLSHERLLAQQMDQPSYRGVAWVEDVTKRRHYVK